VSVARPAPERRRPARAPRALAFAAALVVAGALVLTWPFVRIPRFHLVPAYLHLLGAWLLLVVALVALAGALRRARPEDDDA
jgi:hypothetical protein